MSQYDHSYVAILQERERHDNNLVCVQSHAVLNSSVTHVREDHDETRAEFTRKEAADMARNEKYPKHIPASANCPGTVFSPAGVSISLTFVVRGIKWSVQPEIPRDRRSRS